VPSARADARLCGYQAVTSADRSARWWLLGQPFVRRVRRRPQDAALVRCRVTSHDLSLHLEPSRGVSAGLLHFPAGNAAAPITSWAPGRGCCSASSAQSCALRRVGGRHSPGRRDQRTLDREDGVAWC